MSLGDFLSRVPRVRIRTAAAALFAGLILHIVATLVAPRLAPAPAYTRLTPLLPVNTMLVLPPIAPNAQPLPFMGPDARYAMCRFDTTKSPVTVSAVLPGAGWSLSLFSDKGDNFYTAVAQPGRRTEVLLVLAPSDERFTGLSAEASGQAVKQDRSLSLAAKRGIAVLRAPDQGLAYRAINEAELKRSVCASKGAVASAQ